MGVKMTGCDSCDNEDGRYCCPSCDRRSCSVNCVKQHKLQYGCTGKRARTDFVPIEKFDDSLIVRDYRFLEEVGREEDSCKRSIAQTPQKAAGRWKQLQKQVTDRGTTLMLMPPSFSRRKQNTTSFSKKTGLILWRVEWLFPFAGVSKVSALLPENTVLRDALAAMLEDKPANSTLRCQLRTYLEQGLSSLTLLLRAEAVQGSALQQCFNVLDPAHTVQQALHDQVIVEFPTIVVMLASEAAAAALEESPEAATAAVNPDSKPEGEGTAEGEETANCLPTAPEGFSEEVSGLSVPLPNIGSACDSDLSRLCASTN